MFKNLNLDRFQQLNNILLGLGIIGLFFIPLLAYATPSTTLLITEVYYNTKISQEPDEFIEIYNSTPYLINLSGYKLSDTEGTHTFPTGSVLPAYATITIAKKGIQSYQTLGNRYLDFEWNDTDPNIPDVPKTAGLPIVLANPGDEVILIDNLNIVIDVVTYETGSYTGVISHPGVSKGKSLQRESPNQDTDDCSQDFVGGTPTPTTLRNIVVSPIVGTVGSFVTISGQGFFATEGIVIDFGTTSTVIITTTDAAGSFSTTLTIQLGDGTVTVSATGKTSNAKVNTEFNIITIPPTITITHPFSPGAQANTFYLIGWQDDDPDSNATITLYYDTDNIGTDGIEIVTGISEDDETDYYEWNTSSLLQGSSYYIYAKIEDGANPAVYSYSSGPVIIDHRQSDGNRLPWHNDGQWLVGDIHLHTIASDGGYSAITVAQQAKNFGADFIAITDHGDDIRRKTSLGFGTYNLVVLNIPIQEARKAVPELIIFEGVEWNVPGAGNGGHATVLVTNSPKEHEIISSFTTTFDSGESDSKAVAGLQWLATCQINDVIPICSLNHPSRESYNLDTFSVDWNKGYTLEKLRLYDDINDVCIGFTADWGHKKYGYPFNAYFQSIGGYHDPMSAIIGHHWDTLLNEGRTWWIRFESDFHSESGDYWPAEFTQTRVYSPSKTYEGVIKGLRAGCAYTVHNNIITGLDFLGVSGTKSAMMGEVLQVTQGDIVTASIRIRPGTTTIDKIELISNVTGTPTSTKVFATWTVNGDWLEMSYPFTNVQNDFYFRIRGSSSTSPVNLWFYSNPIRVKVMSIPVVTITKSVKFSQSQPSFGATLTYTISYNNYSNGTATNCVLYDNIPANTQYVGSSASDSEINEFSTDGASTWTLDEPTPATGVTNIKWNLGTVGPGASGDVSFSVVIR